MANVTLRPHTQNIWDLVKALAKREYNVVSAHILCCVPWKARIEIRSSMSHLIYHQTDDQVELMSWSCSFLGLL